MMSRLKAIVKPLFYCLLASTALRLLFLPVALCVLFVVPSTTHAVERAVGTYAVANCWSDSEGRSVSAFTHFVHKNMRIRYACGKHGTGLRGVVTQNIPRNGRVKAGSKAEVSIVAPPGTEMLEFTWDARLRRVDCRYALQAWADVPGSKPIALVSAKANRNCARLGRAQIAQAIEKNRSIPGATAITQRIKCIGKGKQNWCSAKSANYIRTLQAVVLLKDVQAPAVQILGDTPLAGGAWVRGSQPLNYTASDNIGVERAQAVIGGVAQGVSSEIVPRHRSRRRFHRAATVSEWPRPDRRANDASGRRNAAARRAGRGRSVEHGLLGAPRRADRQHRARPRRRRARGRRSMAQSERLDRSLGEPRRGRPCADRRRRLQTVRRARRDLVQPRYPGSAGHLATAVDRVGSGRVEAVGLAHGCRRQPERGAPFGAGDPPIRPGAAEAFIRVAGPGRPDARRRARDRRPVGSGRRR